jgi:hypothetical protein
MEETIGHTNAGVDVKSTMSITNAEKETQSSAASEARDL